MAWLHLKNSTPLNLAVKLFDHFFEHVLADVDDAHFALSALFRIAGMCGIDHDGLAELTANRAGRRFRRVGRPEHIANFTHSLDTFIDEGDAFFGTWLVDFSKRAFRGSATRHESNNVIKLIIAEGRPE